MRALVTARVKPYYLHHPDLVRGTGHFRVSVERGQALMKALRGRLSGLAQPTYVLDVPGGHGKVPIGPAYLGDDPDALAGRGRVRRTAPLSALTLLDQDVRCRPALAPRPANSTSMLPAFSNIKRDRQTRALRPAAPSGRSGAGDSRAASASR